MEKYKKALPFIIAIQVVICLVLGGSLSKNSQAVKVSPADWQSRYLTYSDGWYADESMIQTEEIIDLLYGPYLALKRGSYRIKVDYTCESDQSCLVSAFKVSDEILKTGQVRLSKNQSSVSWRFTLGDDVSNLEVLVKYNGQGSFHINNISIVSDQAGMRRMFVTILFLFVLMDLFVYFKERLEKNRNVILAVSGMALLASLPLFMKGIRSGHDTQFHLMRIEGIVQELLNGNFPAKLSSLYMDGYGYPVSVFYGDLLLYFPAALRMMGFPVVAAYKCYVFLINLVTCIVSYICFQKIFEKKEIALLTSLAYTTSCYRIVNIYVRMAVGEYSAMIFLPVIALAVFKLYTDDGAAWRQCRKYALLLALGMTGLIGTHVLSTEMVCFLMLLLCILMWKKTFQKHSIITYVLAVLETVILNLYFIIPFVDYYLHVDVNIRHKMDKGEMMIQKNGAQIGEYFAFFQNIFGSHMGLTPGLVLMTALIAAVVLMIYKKASGKVRLYTFLSIWLLFLSARNFPWDYIAAHFTAGRILAQIQFPWRYISLAVIVLAMLFGTLFQQLHASGQIERYQKMVLLSAIACIAMSVLYTSDYADAGRLVNYYDTAEINTYATGSLYIRTGSNTKLLTGSVTGDDHIAEISSVSRNGSHMELYCRAKEDADGSVEVPFFNYKGYRVRDGDGKEYEITDGYNNVIKFTVPAGFSGKFTIDFIQPWYWKAGTAISLLYAVWLLLRGRLFFCRKPGTALRK